MTLRLVTVDGQATELLADDPTEALAWWLRDNGFTAVKVGCEEGACGGCMVQLDGVAVPSCVVPLGRVRAGSRIDTAAHLADGPAGQAVGQALATSDAVQCGFCAPGITVSCATELALCGSLPAEPAAIRQILSSHVCRCTGHLPIAEALCGLTLAREVVESRA